MLESKHPFINMQTLKVFCRGGKNLQHLNVSYEGTTEFKTNTKRQTEEWCHMCIHIYTSYWQLIEFRMPWVLVSWMGCHNIFHGQLVQYPSLLFLPLLSFPHFSFSEQLFYFACLAKPPLIPPLMRKFSFSHMTSDQHFSLQLVSGCLHLKMNSSVPPTLNFPG